MTKGTISVTIKCLKCGSTVFEAPDYIGNDTRVHCVECGTDVGAYSEIKLLVEGRARTPALEGVIASTLFRPGK
jgi:DNA-directed RNA polymerase subunit RPC12/RpoP